ncbi:MAG: MATE family efflux transporter [Phascolarctobacterium sp.]|nr:MATE family efflux transporter [Phascolarctobacterium sp.]
MLQNMTEGKPLSLIISFMIPLLIGNVFQQLYNIADIVIVGRTIGVEALAAVGGISPLFMMVMMLTIGMGNGFSVVTGQRYGANDMVGVRRSIGTGTILSIFTVIFIMLVMHFSIDYLMVLMNMPTELCKDARSYVMIIVDGLAFMMAYNYLSAVMRSLGDSKTPLYFLIISSIANIVLALIFIIKLSWGVPGSAFAMVLAQALSGILCIGYIYYKFPDLHLSLNDFKITWSEAWAHLRMGVPMGMQFSVIGISVMVLQSVCNKFGGEQIAGFTTAARVEQLAVQPMVSIGISMAVFTAQNFGARKFDRIREAAKRCSWLTFGYSSAAAILMFVFGKEIIGIFLDNPSENVMHAAGLYIMYSVPAYLFFSQMFIYRNACQGMGVSAVPFIASTIELVMRCGAAIILADMLGYIGLCLAEPIAWTSGAIFVYISFRYFIKLLEKKYVALE